MADFAQWTGADIGILGPLRLVVDGCDATPGSRQRRLALAVLACRANTPVHADELIDALWGDRPPGSPRNSLNVLIHRMRGPFGDAGRIAHGPGGYRLAIGPSERDADVFSEVVARARGLRDQGAAARAYQCFVGGLDLWRGPVLAEFRDTPAIAEAAGPLEHARLHVAEECADTGLAAGRGDELVPMLSGLLQEHPLSERLHAQLMIALYATGRRAEALAAYRAAHRALTEELGVPPGSDLHALHQHMLDGVPAGTLLPEPPAPAIELRRPSGAIRTDGTAPGRRGPIAIEVDAADDTDTDGGPSGVTRLDSVEELQATVSSMLVPLRVYGPDDRPFDARVEHAPAGAAVVARIRGGPHTVARERRSISSSDRGLVKVILDRRGGMYVSQAGRYARAGAGDLVLCDTGRPYDVVVTGACDVVAAGIPRTGFGSAADRVTAHTAAPIPTDRGTRSVVAAFLSSLGYNVDVLAGPAGARFADALTSMIIAVVTDTTPERADVASDLADRVIAYTLANLGDPALSAELIARRHGISVRHLRRMLRGRGLSLSLTSWITRERLHRIRRDLLDPANACRGDAEIAARWGMRAGPGLARAFHAEFGHPLADLRPPHVRGA